MELSKKKSLLGQIGLFYAAAVWGSTFYLIRDVVVDTDPLVLTGYRFLIAAFFLGLYLLIKKEALWSNLKYGFGMSILVTLVYAIQAVGLQFTSAASSGFITGLFVAFVPFFAWIAYRKVPAFNKFLAVLIAVLGLWFLTGGFTELNVGDVLTLITAVAYAVHVVFTGLFVKKLSPNVWAFQQLFFTGLICAVLALFKGASFEVPTNASFFSILYLALIPGLSAFMIQVNAQKYVPEIKAAILMSFEPVFAALFAWTLGGEVFSYSKLLGGFFIFLAMIVSELRWRRGN